jgi:hypothetical protein
LSTSAELIQRVREAAEGTPYVVQERPYGFDVTINVVDAQWYTLLRKRGLERVFTHEVRLDEDRKKLSVTDVEHSLRWDAGTAPGGPPSMHAERRLRRGRVHQYRREVAVGVDARTGQLGIPVDYSFRSGEGRGLVREAARELGWSESMGWEQRGALMLAGAIVAVAAVLLVISGIQALLG